MTDATVAIEGAAMDLLRDDAKLASLHVAVIDKVKESQGFPYLEVGDGQLVADPAEGFERSVKAYLSFNVYSQEAGKSQARSICGAVLATLTGIEIDLGPDFHPVELTHESTRYFLDEDGRTHRGVVSFSALIDPTT